MADEEKKTSTEMSEEKKGPGENLDLDLDQKIKEL